MDGLTGLRIPISGLGCGDAPTLERELASVAGVRRVAEDPWVAVISTADPSDVASEARAAVTRLLGIEPDPTHHHGW